MSRYEKIATEEAPQAIGPYSQAVRTDSMLFLSGQIPLVPQTGQLCAGGIEEQAEQVITNIQKVLQAAGCELDDVVKTTCFLTDMNDFLVFNQAYSKHFTNKPARSCVEVSALPKGALVEVEAIAFLPISKEGS